MNAEEPNAEPDALEHRLAGIPRRSAPAGLRAEVLRAAAKIGPAARLPAARPAWWEPFLVRFPLVTGGLAACWLMAWLGGSADRWLNGPVAVAPVQVSAEQVAEAKVQRAELRHLAGLEELPRDTPVAADNRPAERPRPRGDRRLREDGFGRLPTADFFTV
jgi:hypothetical protein